MKGRTSKVHPESSSRKQGKDGSSRRKRNLAKEEQTKAVKKKKMQQRAETPKETTIKDRRVVKSKMATPGKRAKWHPLPTNTRLHLESKMNWLIVSLLYENVQSRSERERHLNLLKERLLKRFETLKVPVNKMNYLENICKVLAKEKKQCGILEEGLALLQKEIDEAVEAAKLRDETIQSLRIKVEELKRELIAEEKRASKLFRKHGSHDLGLPKLSKHSIEAPLLQETFSKIPNQERILNFLNSIP